MNYEKRNLMDGDSKLIKFTDKCPDGEWMHDIVTYVKFKYDLSKDQVEAVLEAADDVEYHDYPTLDDWVEAVIKKAMEHDCWWYDKNNGWEFWSPFPCLEIEV